MMCAFCGSMALIRGECAHCESLCPICEEPLPEDNGYLYFEDGVRRSACERCASSMVNIILLQKQGLYRKGDVRLLVRKELGVQGPYRSLTVRAK